jgi:hypothetical protein
VKVLAKLGLVTAAAATVLFIFIYEFQGPVINRVMSEPPVESVLPENNETIISEPAEEEINTDALEPLETETEETVEEIVTETEIDSAAVTQQPATESLENEQAAAEPVIEDQPAEIPTGPTRHVYGKITLSDSGEQLGGVNIMVPGSASAKVSNPNGGYTIEVPESARELVFIYRGKKLIKRINPDNSLVNVVLNLETMQYD